MALKDNAAYLHLPYLCNRKNERTMKTLLLMVMMLTGRAMSCRAQLTLEACQQMAKQNYPLIKRYDLIRRSAAYNVSNIKKAWLPQVQATAQATVQNRTTQLPDRLSAILAQNGQTYEGIGKEQYRLQVEISQTLWDGGRISRQAEVEKHKAEVEEAQTDVNLYALRRRVSDLFFSQLLLDERIRLNAQLQAMLQSNEDKLRAMLQRGVAMQSAVERLRAGQLRVRATRNRHRGHVHLAERLIAGRARNLNDVLLLIGSEHVKERAGALLHIGTGQNKSTSQQGARRHSAHRTQVHAARRKTRTALGRLLITLHARGGGVRLLLSIRGGLSHGFYSTG